MTHSLSLDTLTRPRLLVRAARLQAGSAPDSLMTQIFGSQLPDGRENRINTLLVREDHANTQRKTGDAAYSIARHIQLLAGLMIEAKAGGLPT